MEETKNELEICVDCPRKDAEGECVTYTPEGMLYRNKMGWCPIVSKGPVKPVWWSEVKKKERAGQKKTRRSHS